MFSIIAYIPFVHPIDLVNECSYLLLLPLAFGISVIYKAIRLPHLEHFWRHVAVMTAQIVLIMIGLAICLVILVVWLIPAIPVD